MKLHSIVVALGVLAVTVSGVRAQSPCIPGSISVEGPPFFEAWVCPSHGSDGSGVVSQPSGTPSVAAAKLSPFKTINVAISAVAAFTLGQNPVTQPGIVHLEPATYDPSTQSFPILMKSGVNLQGHDARSCVLREGDFRDIFFPDGDCDCGIRSGCKVIVDFSASALVEDDPDFSEAIDSVTFQGGNDQVYAETKAGIEFRVSNCIFDMIAYPGLFAPDAGILAVHTWDVEGYRSFTVDVFNNTFIMGWLPAATGGALLAKVGAVGIIDVNDPLCGVPGGDTNHSLRNIGFWNVQNNLCRTKKSASRTFSIGFPKEDLSVTGPIDTNIFQAAGTVNANGTACVNFRAGSSGTAPVSAAIYDDPAFVGEMLTVKFGMSGLNVGRDWRVMPDSFVIDKGVKPDANQQITAANFLVYTEPSGIGGCTFSAIDSFDWDGEGYGNQRVIGSQVDVGFDEFEMMIDSGYGNESLTIPNIANPCAGAPTDPCYCSPFAGGNSHGLIFKTGGNVVFKTKAAACPGGPPFPSYTIPPGSDLPPTPLSNGILWFTVHTQTQPLALTSFTYTPPDTTATHSFALKTFAAGNTGQFRLYQGKKGGIWSNLQASFD